MARKSHQLFQGDSVMADQDAERITAMRQRPIASQEDARALIDLLAESLDVPPVGILELSSRDCIRMRGWYRRPHGDRPSHIRLYAKGQNYASLLHEFSHHVERIVFDGPGHDANFAITYSLVMTTAEGLI